MKKNTRRVTAFLIATFIALTSSFVACAQPATAAETKTELTTQPVKSAPAETKSAKTAPAEVTVSYGMPDFTDHAPIRVGMLEYPNFIDYDQNGFPSGFSCDYLDEIAKYTGWTYEYIPVSFSKGQQMLEDGTLDIIPGTQYTEERSKRYDYGSVPMVEDANVLCALVDNYDYYYNDFQQLEGKNIGVMTGSIRKEQFEKVLKDNGVHANFIEFDTDIEEKKALNDGEVVAILMTMLRCTPEYRIIGSTNPSKVYFTCNPKDPEIKQGLDEAMLQILEMNPYYATHLSERYYGDVPRAYAFSEEERAYMKDAQPIKVAVTTDMIPVEFYNSKTGEFGGLSIDYLEKISDITGLQFEYVARGDVDETRKALEDGTLQMLASIPRDANVTATFQCVLTDSYVNNDIGLIYNKDIKNPLSTDNRMAMRRGINVTENLAKQNGYDNLIYFDTLPECIEAVNSGKADVMYMSAYSITHAQGHAYNHNIMSVSSPIANYDISFGISKQCDPLLASIMDKALISISIAERDNMLLNAVTHDDFDRTIKDTIYENVAWFQAIVAFFSVILALIGLHVAIRRSKVNRKLAEAMEKVQKANAAKADFVSRMSHDMRTPMNGILGLTELSKETEDVTVLKDNMSKINQSGQYLLCLINDTLDFQKIENGNITLSPETVSARELISNVLMMIKLDAEKKNVDVRFDASDLNLDEYVQVDPVRIKQVFFNLLSNAVKFTQPGGIVSIEMKRTGRTGNVVHDVVTISDTGIGMSEDFIKNKIFKPFSQEHSEIISNYSGSGLGLSIVYRLIQLMKGDIKVESELGVGSKFIVNIDFEIADKTELQGIQKQTELQEEEMEEVLKGKHILLAEDHPLNAEIARSLLEKKECIVEWMADGKKCLDCFAQSEEGHFDAILMDIRMPNMDGITATRSIRALDRADAKTIPIIALTANAYDADIKNCLDAGMNTHIGKPIDVKKLYITLSQYMR